MQRQEALEKIAWHHLKKLSGDEATDIIINWFSEPLKPSLREKLNLTAVLQWETHEPPPDLKPGNPIYRPVLLDKMMRPYRGATNEYLLKHLREDVGVDLDSIEGEPADWLACPVCGYHTFETLGAWDTCTVCGWNSDPVQEMMHDDPTGANGISLNNAKQNFEEFGAITREVQEDVNPDGPQMYPRST